MNEPLLLFGDCLIEMKKVPSASVSLIWTDLPYGVTRNSKDKRIPFEPLWKEYLRILKPNGAVLLSGQGLFYVDLVNSNRKMFRYDYCWDKVLTTGFLNAKKMPLRRHEQIAVFYRKLPTYNPQFTEGAPLHSRGVAYVDAGFVNNNYGKFGTGNDSRKGSTQKYPTSVLRVSKPHPSASKHRTEKPEELTERLILTYTNPGDIVMDSCMGAGGCGVVAGRLGRGFVGIEMDPVEFRKALENISVNLS